MSFNTTTKTSIGFVYGLWLHTESWRPWIEFFRQNGYKAMAAKRAMQISNEG